MKLSVVIPAYNEEGFIGSCLAHLTNQTRAADEIIVVDNNSTDTTAKIVQEFPTVTLLTEKQQGQRFAITTGYDAASGDLLVRTDADSQVPPDWLDKIERFFEQNTKIDALSGPIYYYDTFLKNHYPSVAFFWILEHVFHTGKTLIGGNMALRKEIWYKIRPAMIKPNKKTHEDLELGMRVWEAKGRVSIDTSLIVPVSGRRAMSKPFSFFVEYPSMFFTTLSYTKSNPLSMFEQNQLQ